MISTWGRVVSYVNGPREVTLPPWDPKSDFAKFDNELYGMHSSLPQLFIYTRNNLSAAIAENRAHSLIFLHITIRHSLYFLHRWLFPSKLSATMTGLYKDAPPDFINSSARKCIAAANAISTILADLQDMNTLLLVPFIGFCAFTTATLHVSNAFSPDQAISSAAKRHLATNLKILMIMRKHWYPLLQPPFDMSRTVTERWCQAVRELYELQQNSAGDRKGNFAQNTIANTITYGSFQDDIPNKYDKQQFLYQRGNGGSSSQRSSVSKDPPSESPSAVGQFLQSSPQLYLVGEKPSLMYPPEVEVDLSGRRKADEERAMLEAMQSASIPVSPYLGPGGFMNFSVGPPHAGEDGFEFGNLGMGFGLQDLNGTVGMENFPSLDEIISSMEGGGLDNGFGFLDDLNLFEAGL
jgi:hypothetical protein